MTHITHKSSSPYQMTVQEQYVSLITFYSTVMAPPATTNPDDIKLCSYIGVLSDRYQKCSDYFKGNYTDISYEDLQYIQRAVRAPITRLYNRLYREGRL